MEWILRNVHYTKVYASLFDALFENFKSLLGYIDVDYRQDMYKRISTTRYIKFGVEYISLRFILHKCVLVKCEYHM